MTLEERIEMHDQWLLSMESNHSRMAADLADLTRKHDQLTETVTALTRKHDELTETVAALTRKHDELTETVTALTRKQERLTELVVVLGQNQNSLFSSLASLTTQVERGMQALSAEMQALAEQHRKLEETVERYIRFRGNGRGEN